MTLDDLERLERKATAGPWAAEYRGGSHRVDSPSWPVADCGLGGRDAALIAAMHNALPELLAVARETQALLAAAKPHVGAEYATEGATRALKAAIANARSALDRLGAR